MSASGSSYTPRERRQRHLEQASQAAAKNAAAIARAKLRQQQRESATEYGRALFATHGEAVALGLEHAIGKALNRELVAGPYHAGMMQLFQLGRKGPRAIAAVALGAVLDRLSSLGKHTSHRALANAIGRAIEEEARALPVEDRGADLLRIGRRRHGTGLVSARRLRELNINAEPWTSGERFQTGAFLLEIIQAETGLVRTTSIPGRRGQQIQPTPELEAIISAHPPTPLRAKRLPMLVPPRPWEGMTGGGHLSNTEPLVRSRQGLSLDYLDGRLGPALAVVNALQGQQLEIDPWMVSHQRIAWDANLRGLFPLLRDPLAAAPRPEEHVGPEAFVRWQREAQRAHQDRIMGATARSRIEQSLRQMEQLAGEPVWFAWSLDFRGRLYTANRFATHQGPDHEKAAILLPGGRCDQAAAGWILKAAAGHWGERGSWAERLAWGEDNARRMVAAAEEPLDRLELWRDAKDPWQFLACCRALQQWLADPSQPIRQPIRLDQTTSGPGIIAALVRSPAIARATNMIGTTRHDLYERVAADVVQLLRSDLEAGDIKEQRLAGFWLERGVSRAMAKGPVMTSVYGAQLLGVAEHLAALLDEAEGEVSLARLERERLVPCRYLARKFGLVLGARLGPAMALQGWMRSLSRACLQRNQPLAWTSPAGLPIRVGRPVPAKSRVPTLLHGRRSWQTLMDQPLPGELSARETSRSITANLIHSFDAAMAWAVVCGGAEQGIPVLPNHDCFAVAPCDAPWLAATLSREVRALYQPEWLPEIAAEIAAGAGLPAVPPPPMVGGLDPSAIGENPYLFS